MSAKEMFEELGYKYKECKYQGEIESISYITEYKYDTKVRFELRDKTYITYCEEDSAGYVDTDLYKAINKQIEELRWE